MLVGDIIMTKFLKMNLEKINSSLFIFYIFSYLFLFEFFENNKFLFNFRHYILFFCFLISFLSMILKYDKTFLKDNLYCKKSIYVLIVGVIFLIFSFFAAHKVGYSFSFRSVVQTSLFVLPTIYVFNIINILPIEKIIKLLKIVTLIFVMFYFTEERHTIFEFLKLENWRNISYTNSNSFTESHICAESFLQLFLFFFFIKRYYKNRIKIKNLNLYTTLNFIFTILSFKRLGVLFAIIIMFGSLFINYNKKIKFKSNLILTAFFVIMTTVYSEILKGTITIHGLDINKLTTNRDYILSLWSAKNYFSYGYGTSLYVIGRYLEMDLMQIYMEIGIFCLTIFIYFYLSLAGKKLYTNLIIIYVLFNLLTSSTMPWTSGWVLLIINLCVTSSDMLEKNMTNKEVDL